MKLAHGLKDGHLVHVSAVDRGQACGCACPACGAPLVAHKGEKIAHHFKHQGDTSCPHVTETTLHLLAKEIIEEGRTFRIPTLRATTHAHDIANRRHTASRDIIAAHRQLNVDRVWSEHVIGEIVPDLVLEVGGAKLLVEIAVTHFVDEAKLAKIRTLGISTIEVDLSRLDRMASRDDVRRALREVNNMTWLFNRRQEEVTPELEQQAKTEAEESNQKIQTAIERARRWEREDAGGAGPSTTRDRQHELWQEIRSLIPQIVARRNVDEDEVPPWIGIPVRGDYIFDCPREIWQGAVCAWLERKYNGQRVTPESMAAGLARKDVPIRPEIQLLWSLKKRSEEMAKKLPSIPTHKRVTARYMDILEEYGMLAREFGTDSHLMKCPR